MEIHRGLMQKPLRFVLYWIFLSQKIKLWNIFGRAFPHSWYMRIFVKKIYGVVERFEQWIPFKFIGMRQESVSVSANIYYPNAETDLRCLCLFYKCFPAEISFILGPPHRNHYLPRRRRLDSRRLELVHLLSWGTLSEQLTRVRRHLNSQVTSSEVFRW